MRAAILVGLMLACAGVVAEPAKSPAPDPLTTEARCTERLLGPAYPLEACVSFHAALLHWLDSLTALNGPGMTSGKTREAHRLDFTEAVGAPAPADLKMLTGWAESRVRYWQEADPGAINDLVLAFFETGTAAEALERAAALVGDEDADRLRSTFERFAPVYEQVWSGGELPDRFIESSVQDKTRKELGRFLAGVARFYGVKPKSDPPPRLVLAPVQKGYGTHAQAIGRTLLIEVRPGDSLLDQVSPVVHENAHFLFYAVPIERRAAMEKRLRQACDGCEPLWVLLAEALPTAIGQGVAGRRFLGDGWSGERRWYHIDEVDRLAKQIYPLVERALAGDQRFDGSFLDEVVQVWQSADEAVAAPTRRSP